MDVVEPTNEMKSVFGLIRAEENKILFEMCQIISLHRNEISAAVTAVAELDVFLAKAKLGQKLKGIIPEVLTVSVFSIGCLGFIFDSIVKLRIIRNR